MAPISISIDGAAEAVEFFRDLIVPWRRAHAEKLASLELMQSQVEIEQKKAEILERRAQTARSAEINKLNAEVVFQKAQAEKINLENEKLRLELQQEKIKLALSLVEKLSNNLSETEKISSVNRILPVLETLLSSDLQIESVTPSSKPKTG
jgi:hypothetical protein